MAGKRKLPGHQDPPPHDDEPFLALTLSTIPSAAHRHPLPRVRNVRRRSTKPLSDGKSATILPPYPWSTDRRATAHSLHYLLSNGIASVSGDVECRRCERRYSMEFDLREKANEILPMIAAERESMRHRAPEEWDKPNPLRCRVCSRENSVRPLISEKKRSINWLFLLLGRMLGFCKLEQLKYFCKHTNNHRTGARNRLLFLTCLGICKQIDPEGPFDIAL